MDALTRTRLSVIVPAHQGAAVLPRSLAALHTSDLPRSSWELIVVDDSSTDGTADVARGYADQVVRLVGGPSGPAYARNRGADVARGEVLVFIDSDVCVHPDTLRRFAELFEREPEVGAAFGAYDVSPPAPGVVSQYRNLLHHYVHSQNQGDAETFWAGCGAVRREAFLRTGGFDALTYQRPQVEDIELGYRLRSAGFRIVLEPQIQATHLKQWSLSSMVVTDLRDRGIPWVRLLIGGTKPVQRATLNVRPEEKFCTALTGFAGLLLTAAAVLQTLLLFWLALGLLAVVLILNIALFRWFVQQRGAGFGVLVIPLRLLYYVINVMAVTAGWALHLGGAWSSPEAAPALGQGQSPRH